MGKGASTSDCGGEKVKNTLSAKKVPSEKQHPVSDQAVGKIDPADFDRVLFFCIPSHTELYYPLVQDHKNSGDPGTEPQNNNISTNQNNKEVIAKDVMEEESETSEQVEKRSKKLKLLKSCALL